MEFIITTIASAVVTTSLLGFAAWMTRTWIKERLTSSIRHEYDIDLEKYKSKLSVDNSL